jgi:hypothetical protein
MGQWAQKKIIERRATSREIRREDVMGMIRGQNEFRKFQTGSPLSPKEAILTQCFVCNGEIEGSGEDCKGDNCPLYRYFRKWLYRGRASILRAEEATSLNAQDKELAALNV